MAFFSLGNSKDDKCCKGIKPFDLGLGIKYNIGVLFQTLCSFLLDGVDETINIDEALPSLATTTVGTWLGVIKIPDATPSGLNYIITFGVSNANSGIFLFVNTAGLLRVQFKEAAANIWDLDTDAVAFTDNTWHTIAVVQDGVSPRLLIDGIEIAQTFISTIDKTKWFNDLAVDNGRLGCRNSNSLGDNSFMDGTFNQVALLDTDLSNAQILDWHNEGLPKDAYSLFPNNCVWQTLPSNSTYDSVNSEFGIPNVANLPTIEKSFLIELGELFIVPNVDIASYLQGASPQFSLSVLIKRESNGNSYFFGNDGVQLTYGYMTDLGVFWVQQNSLGISKNFFNNTSDFSDISIWRLITIVHDGNNVANNKLFVNGVELTIDGTSVDGTSFVFSTDYAIGQRNTNLNLIGYENQLSILNRVMTLAEHITLYNNGNPLNPKTQFGADCKYFFNPNDSIYNTTLTEYEVPYIKDESQFYIEKSFELDGVNEYLDILNADLSPYLAGSNKVFSINYSFYLVNLATLETLFSLWSPNSLMLRKETDNTLTLFLSDSGNFITDITDTLSVGWNHLTIVYDSTQALGSRGTFFLNGSTTTKNIDNLTTNIDNSGGDYHIGAKGLADFLNGNVLQISITDTALTLADHQTWYNNGLPLNPQTQFGADCKYFFNPTNSGDTAQFSVVDSINGITATSVNMEDVDKQLDSPYLITATSVNMEDVDLKYRAPQMAHSINMEETDKNCSINPYVELSLDSIFERYGFLNMWSTENLDVSGTTTTLLDYANEHDLANPTVASQPTLNASDVNFNGKPSITFNGTTDYLQKLTPNWRASDNSGVFISVYKKGATAYGMLCTSDKLTNTSWFSLYQNGASRGGFIKSGADVSLSLTANANAKVYAVAGTGTAFKNFLNGVDDTGTPSAYSWLDSLPSDRDNITVGAVQRSSVIYGNYDLVLSGYLPYTDDATLIALQNELQAYYGI